MKKVLATLLALAMIVTGFMYLNPNASEVDAATASSESSYITVAEANWNDSDKDGVPDLEDYLFAGYFKSEVCTQANKATKETATHAKFVKADTLDVKVQITNGVVQKSDVQDEDGNEKYVDKYVIRFVSSVESLDYSKIGFELELEDGTTLRNTSNKVYTRIDSSTGVAGGEIDTYDFSPKMVGEDSEYFMTAKLPVEVGNEGVTYKVRAFWKTLDGTEVFGQQRCVSINDSGENIINVTVDQAMTVGGAYTATYGPNAEGTGADATKVEVLSSENGHSNVRITLGGEDTALGLKSATKFVITGAEGTVKTIYRNYYTDVAGTPDTSWYDVDPTATRFAIASVSDLYGLASIVNGGTDLFYQNEIHLVRSVEVNKGLAIRASESADGVAKWKSDTTPVAWTPIGHTWGGDFRGNFDGDDNTISGLYAKGTTMIGLFGYAGVNNGEHATFKNFRVTNSYFEASSKKLGLIAYGYGIQTVENVYTDAIFVSTSTDGTTGDVAVAGGIVGQYNPVGNYTGVTNRDETMNPFAIKNCWFDGEINVTSNSGTLYAGGLAGALGNNQRYTFVNCLNTGVINSASTTAQVGGVFGANLATQWIQMENCLSVGEIDASESLWGGFANSLQHTAGKLDLLNCYTSLENVWTTNQFTSYAESDFIKSTEALAAANVNTLFPGHKGAWVNDVNDAQTPILSSFASWWKEKQYEAGLDTSWYDADATEYVITTAAQLNGLAELAKTNTFSGKTIKLGANIALNKADSTIVKKWVKGTAIADNMWTPIGTSDSKFAGTFDGQGYTISGLYLDSTAVGAGLFGYTDTTAVLKNFKFVDSYITSTRDNVGMIGYGSFELMENVYTNATFKTTGQKAGGFVGQIVPRGTAQNTQYNITFSNCWFDGDVETGSTAAGGFIGQEDGATGILFKNCLSTGSVKALHRAGGFQGWKNAYAWHEFRNCLSVAETTTASTDATFSTYRGAYYGDHNTSTYNMKVYNSYGLNKIAGKGADAFETATYVKTRDELLHADEATLFPVLDGETENAWVSDGATGWNNTDRGTPILATFAQWWIENVDHDELIVDFSWYNDTDTEFTLYDAADMNGLAYVANNTDNFTGKTIKLGADIQFNKVNDEILASWKAGTAIPENAWTPIGTSAKPFNGTFDGQGHEISGLYLSATTEGAGLFGHTGEATEVKNFKFVDSYMTSTAGCLGLIGVGKFVNIENIYTNATIVANDNLAGGFVGIMYNIKGDYAAIYSTIKNCWFDGTITQTNGSKYGMGGFVGGTNGAGSLGFYNCLSTGTVTGGFRVGGFYGWRNYYALFETHNCLSVADVSANVATNYEEFEHLVASFYGDYSSNTWNANMYNSYGLNKINGNTSWTKFETTDYIKTRTELINTDEATLFPVLNGETENAWVNDIGYNTTDRGTPILASFAEWWLARQPETELVDRADTSWYNDNDTEFVLTTQAELYGFAVLGQTKTFEGKTVKLGNDIALNAANAATVEAWKNGTVPVGQWTPVGTSSVPFAGIFDGQGYTISGLYLNTNVEGAGLFGHTNSPSEIKNFKLVDSFMKSSASRLGIIGKANVVSMENIYTNAVMISTAGDLSDVGGLIGTINKYAPDYVTVYTSITNCWFDGYVENSTSGRKAGGFIGGMSGAASVGFYNCLSTGTVTGGRCIGGFFGAKDVYATCEIKNCLSVATVTANPTNQTYAGQYGSFFGDHSANPYNSKMYTSYSTFQIIGSGTAPATGTVMERNDLVITNVKTLFPESDAWVSDSEMGYNDTDRGTPILATFADFWRTRQPEPVYTVDKSWYNTTDNEFTLYDLADFRGFIAIANGKDDFTGKIVKLGANMVLNTPNVADWKAGTAVADFEWTPIGTEAKPFNGTFDGQGFEISGLYLNSSAAGVGLFGYTGTESEFKNFKLIDSYIASTTDDVGMIGKGSFKLMENVYTNATIEAGSTKAAGFVGCIVPRGEAQNTQYNIVFNNCWFDGDVTTGSTSAGGFVGSESAATGILFTNCLSTGVVKASLRAGGFYGWKNAYAWHEFHNCLSIADTTITTTTGDNAILFASYYGDHNTSTYNMKMYNSYGIGKIAGKGADAFETATYVKTRTEIIDTDEKFLFPVLAGETENAWVNDIGYNDTDRGTPILASFAQWWMEQNPAEGLQSRPDTSWYDAGATEFTLTTADQFYGFAQLAKITTFEGKTVKLGANIVLNEVDETILGKWQEGSAVGRQWTPIGTASSKFTGTFDGQGYEISGLYHKSTGANVGLFGTVAHGSVIRNFKLIDSYIYGNGNVGIIGTGLASTIEKIYTNAIIESTANNAGGIIGGSVGHYTDKTVAANENWAQGIMVINECWFDGQINMLGSAYSGGGILGAPGQRSRIDFNNCLYTGTITSERTDVYTRLGGFIGWENASAQYNFTNCLSVGSYEAADTSYVGGFIGNIGGDGVSFTNCYTTYPSANTNRVGIGTGTNAITYTNTSLQTRVDLSLADLATLFAGSNAWVQDSGYNNVDRGTPILASFAEWWIARQDEGALEAAPSIAWYTGDNSIINNKGDLLGFLTLSKQGETFDGETIKLGANITLNTPDVNNWKAGKNLPAYQWTPVTFNGNFDGQGHSISGIYVKSSNIEVGFFGKTAAGSSITNFRLLDSYIEQTFTSHKWSHFTGSVVADAYGNISNVYSNATIVSPCHYVGGIAGRVNPSNNTDSKITISNCWFDGTIELADETGYTGGIVAIQQDGKLYFENVLNTGHIKANFPSGARAFIGGALGKNNLAAGLETHFESVVSAGTYNIPNGTAQITSIAGYLENGFINDKTPNVAAVNPKYSFSNVFASREWNLTHSTASTVNTNGTIDANGTSAGLTSTIVCTGQIIQTSNGDRLIGYVPQVARDINNDVVLDSQKLDFTSAWTMRTNDVPIPTALKDVVDVRTIVSDAAIATLTNELGLGSIGGSLSNAVAEGAGDYVVTVSGTKATYDSYLQFLNNETNGFKEQANNVGTPMEADGVYSATYYKTVANNLGEWVVNVTFVTNDGKIYVSLNSDVDSMAKTLVDDDAKNPIGTDTGTNAVALSMVEDKEAVSITGNCFVFQLPNGHFIINDGNTDGGAGAILKAYLQSQVGEGNPIIIDAWTISHFHNDHAGALMDFATDASLRENVYLNALYANEPSAYGATLYEWRTTGDINSAIQGAKLLTKSPTDNSAPDFYEVHMGQRYYFNGLTMDVVNTPEQIEVDSWTGGEKTVETHTPDPFNTSSVNFVFTLNETSKRVLIGGDSTKITMQYIIDAYGENNNTLANINVFAAYHHGKNAMNQYNFNNGSAIYPTSNKDGYVNAGKANTGWADFLLNNTNNESNKFDVMLFPFVKKFSTYKHTSTSTEDYYLGQYRNVYVGDDGSVIYPWNIGAINADYANRSNLHLTVGYEDSTSATDATPHGTVRITFNANGNISWMAYKTLHGQEADAYVLEPYPGSVNNGTVTPDSEI